MGDGRVLRRVVNGRVDAGVVGGGGKGRSRLQHLLLKGSVTLTTLQCNKHQETNPRDTCIHARPYLPKRAHANLEQSSANMEKPSSLGLGSLSSRETLCFCVNHKAMLHRVCQTMSPPAPAFTPLATTPLGLRRLERWHRRRPRPRLANLLLVG